MTLAPIDIRLYLRPIGVSLPESPMPQSNTLTPPPPCILCKTSHPYTPYAVGWMSAGWPVLEERMFVVCIYCADSDDALKAKIRAQVATPVAAE
jgi:hypothetical protein